jgi:uncharacterized damage-inducible protein DinB
MPAMPAPIADERDQLLSFLRQQRDGVRYAAFGLTDEQAAAAPTTSSLSVGALVKHVAHVERGWIDIVLQRDARSDDYDAYAESFRFEPSDSLAAAVQALDEVAAETEAVIREIADLGQPVPIPQGVPWFPQDVAAWSVRWVLLHLIEETARHAGHADMVRESVDGATSVSLMAGAEGWPETDWVKPWKAAS